MPQWNTGELVEPPRFKLRNWFSLLGPGLLMGGAAIGGGEWLMGPAVTARYGGALLWLATISILGQVIYNIEISRYALYSGEPIFTGKFRTLPGPRFWLCLYILLDFGALFPYLAANAATPLAAVILGHIPDPGSKQATVSLLVTAVTEKELIKLLGYVIFLVAMLPLIFGGKIYNSLKLVMTFKIVVVLGFLLMLALMFPKAGTWTEIFSGFVKFGNVPILTDEDRNGNGVLDPGEDWDGDGKLDVIEQRYEQTVDTDGDGTPDNYADIDGDGTPDPFDDVDNDGIRDGDNIDNIFSSLIEGRGIPDINFNVLALLCALVAISGSGGLSNAPISNYTRDQGWGMGRHVGAIPSVVGAHHLKLSHVGTVFEVNDEVLPRWRRWYRHVVRDQVAVWMPACFFGLALPSMLSIRFLPRGFEADNWTMAGMTADGVQDVVVNSGGSTTAGSLFWFMTLFCGFLVLAPTMATSADGIVRRWVDVFWTGSARLRRLEPGHIRGVYFAVLCCYMVFGLTMLTFVEAPVTLLLIAGNIFNYALGFSCLHALIVNSVLLPRPLRPNWFIRLALLSSGVFFLAIAGLTTASQWAAFPSYVSPLFIAFFLALLGGLVSLIVNIARRNSQGAETA